MSKSGSLQSPRSAPHLRLNSGRGDLDDQDPADAANSNKPLGPRAAQPRSLIPPSLRSGPAIRPAIDSPGLDSPGAAESAELLLPPTRSKTHRFRDDDPSSRGSPNPSGFSSRRTSWSSEAGSRDSRGFGANPFEDSRAPSRSGSDDENVNTQTVSEKYNILPSAGLLLFPEDVEKDDWLHNPDPNEKPIRECDIFTRRGFMNIGGLSLITLGLLILFIGYPILYVPSQTLYLSLATHTTKTKKSITNKFATGPSFGNTQIHQILVLLILIVYTWAKYHY